MIEATKRIGGFCVTILRANGVVEKLHLQSYPTLKDMQSWVGGYIERVPVNATAPCKTMLVNEDGLGRNLPVNVRASAYYDHGPIVGDVALLDFDLE